MNIFYTDRDPDACARMLDDRRLVKMVLETCQILSTAVWETGGEGPYKRTHTNHPSCVWARSNAACYAWTWLLFQELATEYEHRFGKTHKSWAEHGTTLGGWTTRGTLPEGGLTLPPQCTTGLDQQECVREAYRTYMRRKWDVDGDKARWTRRRPPEWGRLSWELVGEVHVRVEPEF